MNRLYEIAKELGNIASVRFYLKQQLETIAHNIKTQEAAIIPAGGWPGSNADTRKAAEIAAKAADEPLRMFAADKAAIEEQLDLNELKRETLTAEREAITWTIRDIENVARGQESVFEMLRKYDDGNFAELDARAAEMKY